MKGLLTHKSTCSPRNSPFRPLSPTFTPFSRRPRLLVLTQNIMPAGNALLSTQLEWRPLGNEMRLTRHSGSNLLEI